eukprot:scaffold4510_cov321-Prasinococcus_capsulatus_cf.AAC.1
MLNDWRAAPESQRSVRSGALCRPLRGVPAPLRFRPAAAGPSAIARGDPARVGSPARRRAAALLLRERGTSCGVRGRGGTTHSPRLEALRATCPAGHDPGPLKRRARADEDSHGLAGPPAPLTARPPSSSPLLGAVSRRSGDRPPEAVAGSAEPQPGGL